MRVSKIERDKLLEFIPPSQMREVSPAVPAVEAEELADGSWSLKQEAIPAVLEPIEDAGVFLSRQFKRREYGILTAALDPEENGDVDFTADKAYRICALALHSVRNIECECDDGQFIPLEIERDEDGYVTTETLDLFDYDDILAYSLWVMKTARLGEDQGEK